MLVVFLCRGNSPWIISSVFVVLSPVLWRKGLSLAACPAVCYLDNIDKVHQEPGDCNFLKGRLWQWLLCSGQVGYDWERLENCENRPLRPLWIEPWSSW
jgi:hypothetical protein